MEVVVFAMFCLMSFCLGVGAAVGSIGSMARAAGEAVAAQLAGKRWESVNCADLGDYPRRICTVRVWDTDTTSTIRLVEVAK